MRITHVAMWYIPGMSYQENYLPKEQRTLGHDVTILTSDRLPAFEGYEQSIGRRFPERIIGRKEEHEGGVTIRRLPCIEARGYGQLALLGLKSDLEDTRPDVVHAHGAFSPTTFQAISYSRKLGYKLFVDDHSHRGNLILDRFSKQAYVSLARLTYGRLASRVDCFLPVTPASAELLYAHLGIPKDRMQLLPLGVDATLFTKSSHLREKGREELGLGPEDVAVITSGKLSPRRELEVLLESISAVVGMQVEVKLVIVGEGSPRYMELIRNQIRHLGLGGRILFVGFVPYAKLPIFYNAADIGVWAGDHTITALEAAASGLPLLLPSADTAYKVLFDVGAVLGFARGDVRSLADGIARLADNPGLRESIGGRAHAFVTSSLSWETIALDSVRIYRETP